MVRGMTRSILSRCRALGALALLVLVAGCASGPQRSADGRGGMPDRDGAPSEVPSDLASHPEAVPRVEPIRAGGPNKPYSVLGQSYTPLTADVPWKEQGVASWYGTKFHGRRTASGELFSMYGFTAAHKTLPIPSYARVRNVKTGKTIIVRINDRGPFHSSRVMDLSYAAASRLGMIAKGNAQVEIERLTFDDIRSGAWQRGTVMDPALADASPGPMAPVSTESPMAGATTPAAPAEGLEAAPRAATEAARGFWVQLAALGRRDGVDRLQQRIASELNGLAPMLAVFQEARYFKLQVGPYASRGEAVAAAEQARETLQLNPVVIERR